MEKTFPAYRGDAPYIFVCYAHADDQVVYPEIGWLHQEGVNIWYDEGVTGGRVWRQEIGERIVGCEKVLFYISRASLDSDHCNREINFALDSDKEIVPVYLEDVRLTTDLALGLSRIQALHRDSDLNYLNSLIQVFDPGRFGNHLTSAYFGRETQPPANSVMAQAAYLRARDALASEQADSGMRHLNQAIVEDPEFTMAYVERALLRCSKSTIGASLEDIQIALELEPDNPTACAASAYINALTGQPEAAKERIDQVFALGSDNDESWALVAFVCLIFGDRNRAISALRKGKWAPPVGVDTCHLFWFAGDLPSATRLLKQSARVNPAAAHIRLYLGLLEMVLGNTKVAEHEIRLSEPLAERLWLPDLIYGYGRLGLEQDALRVFERFTEEFTEDRIRKNELGVVFTNILFQVYLGIGDVDRAYHCVSKVAEIGASQWILEFGSWLPLKIMYNEYRDPVLEQPRFLKQRQKLGYRA